MTQTTPREQEYKETDLGLIPEDWQLKKLNDIAEIKGRIGWRGYTTNDFTKEGLGAISLGVKNIDENNHLSLKEKTYVKWEKYNESPEIQVNNGDIILAQRGSIGKIAIVKGLSEKATINPNVILIKKIKENSDFVSFALRSKSIQERILKGKDQTTVPLITQIFVKKLPIHIPKLDEQGKISTVLSAIEEAKKKSENVIWSLKELKKSLMKHLFTYGVVAFEETGKIKLRETEIGMIPEEWQLKELGLLLKECYRYPTYYNIQYVKEGIPEIRGELLLENGRIETDRRKFRFISKETADKFPKVRLEEGDLVLSVRGTMGKIGYVSKEFEGGLITANLIRLSPKKEFVNSDYLKRYLLSESFQTNLDKLSSKTTIKTIQAPTLKSIKVPLPPFQEQEKIASILSTIDEKVTAEKKAKVALDELFNSMLSNLMSAKIRVNNLEV